MGRAHRSRARPRRRGDTRGHRPTAANRGRHRPSDDPSVGAARRRPGSPLRGGVRAAVRTVAATRRRHRGPQLPARVPHPLTRVRARLTAAGPGVVVGLHARRGERGRVDRDLVEGAEVRL